VQRQSFDGQGALQEDRRYLVDPGTNPTGYSQVLAAVDATTGAVVILNTFSDRHHSETRLGGATSSTNLIHGDALGSVRALTRAGDSASVPARLDYTAFGTPVSQSGEELQGGESDQARSLTTYAFTGERRDAVSGMQYNRARLYLGRPSLWGSQDAAYDLWGNCGHALGYCGHSPASCSDPSGTATLAGVVSTVAIWSIIDIFCSSAPSIAYATGQLVGGAISAFP